jgi:hypothetical protein
VGASRTAGEPPANVPGRPQPEHVGRRPTGPGIAAAELATASLSALEVERWLVDNALAVAQAGRLIPTPLGVELGSMLER